MRREQVLSWLVSLVLHGMGLLLAAFIVFPREVSPFKFIEVELLKIKLPAENKLAPTKRIQQIKKITSYEKKTPHIIPHKEKVNYPVDIKKLQQQPTKEGANYHVDTKKQQQEPPLAPSISQTTPSESLVYATLTATATPQVSPTVPSFFIQGPLVGRKIVYQPKPKLPVAFEREGIRPGEIRLRLWVLPNGHVEKILVLRSSGYAEWDGIVLATARRWRFSHLPPESTRIDWGEVTIKTILQ